jgi:hypothetical protein
VISFLREWARLFGWGSSAWGHVARGIALVAAAALVVGAPAISSKVTLDIEVQQSHWVLSVPTGTAMTAIAVLLWLALTAGPAWANTRGPYLRVATALEKDSVAAFFRLRVWNDSGVSARPRVVVTGIAEDTGRVLLGSSQIPLELQWTHQAQGQRAEIQKSNTHGESVGVLFLQPYPMVAGAPQRLFVSGALHQPSVGSVQDFAGGHTITVDVEVTSPEHPWVKAIRRSVSVKEDAQASLGFN